MACHRPKFLQPTGSGGLLVLTIMSVAVSSQLFFLSFFFTFRKRMEVVYFRKPDRNKLLRSCTKSYEVLHYWR